MEGSGDEVYIVVDPPAPAPAVEAASAEKTAIAERMFTVPAGTEVPVRFATDVSSAATQVGARFTGYLDIELRVGQLLSVPKSSRIFGIVASLEQAGSMSGQSKMTLPLTDIEVNARILPLVSSSYSVQGTSESKDTAKKIAGGAGLGAVIGAIADGGEGAAWDAAIGAGAGTAASAATKAKTATVPAQSVVRFRLEQVLEVLSRFASRRRPRPAVRERWVGAHSPECVLSAADEHGSCTAPPLTSEPRAAYTAFQTVSTRLIHIYADHNIGLSVSGAGRAGYCANTAGRNLLGMVLPYR